MELKLHSDEDGFKSAELVSATLPKGSLCIYPLTSDAIVVEIK